MRARSMGSAAFVSLALLVTACGVPSRQQRVQEAAYDLNMGLRFNNSAMALEKVARGEREKFLARHKDWHGKIRIVDIELVGTAIRDDGDANLFLRVGWQRANETEERDTVVLQKWHDEKGTWLLSGEERAQGDAGLLGDAPIAASSDVAQGEKPARDVQFRTTVIRGTE